MKNITAAHKAFDKVIALKKQGVSFPNQILEERWPLYFFFGDETIFGQFATVVRKLLQIEGSSTCCLVNFQHWALAEYQLTKSFTFETAATIVVDSTTSEDAFVAEMNLRRPRVSWIDTVGNCGCASDYGNWYVYSERSNDVSFIAFKDREAYSSYAEPIHMLRAQPIQELCDPDSGRFPFDCLRTDWRHGLFENYSNDSNRLLV